MTLEKDTGNQKPRTRGSMLVRLFVYIRVLSLTSTIDADNVPVAILIHQVLKPGGRTCIEGNSTVDDSSWPRICGRDTTSFDGWSRCCSMIRSVCANPAEYRSCCSVMKTLAHRAFRSFSCRRCSPGPIPPPPASPLSSFSPCLTTGRRARARAPLSGRPSWRRGSWGRS